MNLKACKRGVGFTLTLVLASTTVHAGDFDCEGTTGLGRVGCGAMVGVVIVVGGTVVAVQEIVAALTPSKKKDARLEGGSEILHVKLNGMNNRNYSYFTVGREKPMLLRCARLDHSDVFRPGDPAPGVFAYGRCVELRPSFTLARQGAATYYTDLASHPMVSFGFSKDGLADSSEAELDKLLEPEKLPRLKSAQISK